MRIAVTGSSGTVGHKVVQHLQQSRHYVLRLVRTRDVADVSTIYWNPSSGEIEKDRLEGLDAVVHLAGDNLATKRWDEAKKTLIYDSRIVGTRLLSETLASLSNPPRVLVSTSAIGFYGNRDDEVLTETSTRGEGFLADVCADWEAATASAEKTGIRVAHIRIGMVLSNKGGALASMLPIFKLGLGGRIGNGKQYWSWISNEDLAAAVQFVLERDELSGPVNFVAPNAPTCASFVKEFAACISRPAVLPLPAFAARLMMGEMADALLLCSARVMPNKLEKAGFEFSYPDLGDAIRHELCR